MSPAELAGWPLAVAAAPIVGSFASVLVVRLPEGRGIILGRSRCPQCGGVLAPQDLIPLVSWIVGRGRCRSCGAPISLLYPGLEIGCVLVAVWAATVVSLGIPLWASCGLGWVLLTLAVIDARTFLLPDALTLPLIAAGLGVAALLDPGSLADHVIGAGAGFLTLWTVAAAYQWLRGREGLGIGDAKLFAAAGAWVSWPALPSVLLFGSLIALAAVIAQGLSGRSLSRTDALPFGPYLCAGLWLTWLYGPVLTG